MTINTGSTSRGRALYIQYTNPAAYPPVDHSAWILAEAGFDVLLLGIGDVADVRALRRHDRIRVRMMRAEPRGWRQKVHHLWFAAWVVGWVMRWRPTWVYASDPLSCPVALLLTWVPGVSVLYHEHDSPSSDVARGSSGSRAMRFVMAARRALARRSVACVLPNGRRAQALRDETGAERVLTVWNCPMRDEIVAVPRGPQPGRLRVFYHGSIVPARLPETVIGALAQCPSTVSLAFAGYETAGHSGYVERLLATARLLGVADRVRFIGTVPTREALLKECVASDVGLALLPPESSDINEQTMVGASNKPFDYLACGLPVIVSELPEWTQTYVDPGFGRSCDPRSPDSIATAMAWMLNHPNERLVMGERGRQRIHEDWNYDSQFAPVMKLMLTRTSRDVSAIEATNQAEPTLPC